VLFPAFDPFLNPTQRSPGFALQIVHRRMPCIPLYKA
jgi:hypothetical protein